MNAYLMPICEDDWQARYSLGRKPLPRMTDPKRCCYCNRVTRDGLFVWVEAATVPYPQAPS